jgi:hypothetical protein
LFYLDVIAPIDTTNAGKQHAFSVVKFDDTILMHQKKQCDMGLHDAMKYFEMEAKEMSKLTWLVLIFDDVKGGGEGKECNGSAIFQQSKKDLKTVSMYKTSCFDEGHFWEVVSP